MKIVSTEGYRYDIDGLRAFAVFFAIIFHFGYLPNGFLGVDIFFVISGYLITGILYNKCLNGSFSLRDFYIRRTRRILPLVSILCIIVLILGALVMLPDDLENLAQSVVATNFFNNNTLMVLTTKNYWDVVNEFKPLMHTWSLAIEEQYYFLYPFIFVFFGKKNGKYILNTLIVLTVISIALFLSPFEDYYKFYVLPFRFYELSLGGIFAIVFNKKLIRTKWGQIIFALLLVLIIGDFEFLNKDLLLIIVVVLSCLLMVSDNSSKILRLLLQNKTVLFLGKISFGMYMWHQIILAFTRYALWDSFGIFEYTLVFLLTTALSVLTFYSIEEPFRRTFSFKKVLIALITMFIVSTGGALFLVKKQGVIRDVPELSISLGTTKSNVHGNYNDRIYQRDKPFTNTNKIKVFVLGDSFGRDWCNILLESEYGDNLEISYNHILTPSNDFPRRVEEADIVFIANVSVQKAKRYFKTLDKVWCVGTKNFGMNNGIFYNNSSENYCKQRTKMEHGILQFNTKLKSDWGPKKYIDLIAFVLDSNQTVPVFDENCKFISPDCRHLTKPGAQFFAQFINESVQFDPITLMKNQVTNTSH